MMIDKDQIEDIFPMSDISFGMVYHALQKPGEAMYHDQIVFNVAIHDFDTKTFGRALESLIGKHENLRSNYNIYDYERPIQLVFKRMPPDFVHEDISHLTEKEQEAFIKDRLVKDKVETFTIGLQTPLWRIKTFTLDKDNLFIVWINHHAIVDGWSTSLIMKELHETYFKLKKGENVVLSKLKSSYRDYVKNELVLKKKKNVLDYWLNELEGVEKLSLPGSYSEGDLLQNYIPKFDKELYFEIKKAAKVHGSSVKNICFSAYAYALYMISNQSDLLMGIISHNRPILEDGEKIVGCFLNTVPVRLKFESSITWKEYIKIVDDKLLELKQYEGLPLKEINKLVKNYNGQSDGLINTFFNYMDFYMYKNIEDDDSRINDDYKSSSVHVSSYEKTDTSLDFMLDVGSERLNLVIRYYESVIPSYLVESLGNYFHQALKNMTTSPNELCRKKQVISENESEQIIGFNNTKKEFKQWTIIEHFQYNVKSAPGLPALYFEEASITYDELDKRSDILADYLLNNGLKPNGVVALCIERSFELIVGIFAIWKARGIYLPIDINYPLQRIKYMLLDSGASVLLTNGVNNNFEALDCKVLDVKSVSNGIKRKGFKVSTKLDDPAYIIYTSGSTGRPKGVVVEHRALTNRINWMQNDYPISSEDRILQKTSISFDVSVWELCWWSTVGAPMVLLGPNQERDPQEIAKSIAKDTISIMHFVPSMLDAFIEYLSNSDKLEVLESLRIVFSSGEALKADSVRKFKKVLPNCKLVNLYGPTEATIDVTAFDCDNYIDEGIIPIGKPIDNTVIYILNKNLEIQPIGVIGDLYIGGTGLAIGYLNQPELTNTKFIKYSAGGQIRLYKSGDIAKWLPDGNIEYVGREDDQVKIRGFRIELGEVENILIEHPDILEVVVTCSTDFKGNKLNAYVVANTGLTLSLIQDFMFEKAPAYMIPSNFYVMDKMPVKENGKVDKKKLPEIAKKLSSGEVFKLPQNNEETVIAEIWKKVLGINKLSVNDNFFQLGGDSISILKVFNELNKAFTKQINVVDLFKYTTINSLSEYYTVEIPNEEPEEDYDESLNMLLDSTKNLEIE